MTKRSAEREAFLSSVITTAVEGGTGYWAGVSEYKWDGLAERDVFAVLHEEDEDGGYESPALRLDVDAVARGFGLLQRGNAFVETYAPNPNVNGGKPDAEGVECAASATGWARPLGDEYRKRLLQASRENEGGDIDANDADNIAQLALLGVIRYG